MNTLANKPVVAENFEDFAQLLKDNGFTVLVSANCELPHTWMFFYKDGKFGHVSKERLSGYHFSTVHKPCRECGTGFRIGEDDEPLTIENANNSLAHAPHWAFPSQIKAIQKYTSLEDFINSTHNKWANYITL